MWTLSFSLSGSHIWTSASAMGGGLVFILQNPAQPSFPFKSPSCCSLD